MAVNQEAGRDARTSYHILERLRSATYAEALLHTGRTHQIRVHLAAIDLPVLGDRVYGVPAPGLRRQFLHAARLALPHPFTGERVDVESPLPDDLAGYLDRLAS